MDWYQRQNRIAGRNANMSEDDSTTKFIMFNIYGSLAKFNNTHKYFVWKTKFSNKKQTSLPYLVSFVYQFMVCCRPCLKKIEAVLQIALFQIFRYAAGVHFIFNCV